MVDSSVVTGVRCKLRQFQFSFSKRVYLYLCKTSRHVAIGKKESLLLLANKKFEIEPRRASRFKP